MDLYIGASACCPLGHQYTFKLINLVSYISNIKPLQWNSADISLPEAVQHTFVIELSTTKSCRDKPALEEIMQGKYFSNTT